MKLIGIFSFLLLFTYSSFSQDNFQSEFAFIENKGQYDGRNWKGNADIEYAYSNNPFYIFFSKEGVTYRFDKMIKNPLRKQNPQARPKRVNISELVNIEWVGANENVEIIADNKVDSYHSFAMIDPKTGKNYSINQVKSYQSILYKNIYDHIDVKYEIHPDGGVKYNVILHPGADPSQLKLKYTPRHTSVQNENTIVRLDEDGALQIKTSLGDVIEHQPFTFYEDRQSIEIPSKYIFENQTLSFQLGNYDASKTVIIDPWIISPNFQTSTAVWEVETDAVGNVYAIGGEDPMELKKYDINGNLQWSYITPWDTNNVWLGTLATDAAGNSYVTSGVTANMHKVDNAGNQVWTTTLGGGLQYSSEWWSITFNCDETQLIVGGTWVNGMLSFDYYAGIFEIDVATGNVISDQTVDYTNIGGFGATPVEVRSISSSSNAKYIFLTHNDVGAINQNIALCPNDEPIFQVDNQDNLGYKCENYLPATQNGGGLKALVANDNYFYTHAGDQIRQWDLTNGTLINTVNLPGGISTTAPLVGGLIVENSGLAVDDCGNVYAGSNDRVVQFDPNLNILSSSNTTFAVYDVSVNSNGEVIACGAQQDNQATNRNGRIESINMSACAQFTLVCCDANFCDEGPFCESDPPIALSPATSGGTWSGPGVDASGNFDPAAAGVGTHNITYTLACGSETIEFTVDPCATLDVCIENNGDLTVDGGNGSYTWYEGTINNINTPINNETECINCPAATPQYDPFFGTYMGCDQANCATVDTVWTQYATGSTTNPPANYPILIEDGSGASIIISDVNDLDPCTTNPCGGVTITINIDSQNDVSCNGGSDGSATISASGGTGPYNYIWSPGNLSGNNQTNLSAGTYNIAVQDDNGCTGSGTVTINEPAPIVLNESSVDATCGATDGSAGVAPTGGAGGYSYSWSPGGQTSATINNIGAGSYDVTVTDANGCIETANIVVSTTSGPTLTVDLANDASCFGANDGEATIGATGGTPGYTYSWSPGGMSGASQTGLTPDTYVVTVEDAAGCIETISVTINEPTQIVLNESSTAATCGATDGSAGVAPTGGAGGYSYSWSPGGQTSATINNIGAGSYDITVTDANGCTETANIVVSTTNGPSVTVDFANDVSCFGANDGQATISATGGTPGYTYTWNPGGMNGASQTGLAADTYTVAVEDAAGCVETISVTINEPDEIIVSTSSTPSSCTANDGTISANVTGGVGPYNYSWSPGGQTTANVNNVGAGAYDVTVTDDNGCTATASVNVQSLNGPVITVDNVTDASCPGASDGSATVSVTGGTPAYTYNWTPSGGNAATANNLPAGSYNVTVTDNAGCISVETVIIGESDSIQVTGNIENASCMGDDGSITISASGGSGNYTYTWNTSDTGNQIDELDPGIYDVTVTDNNGCSSQSSYNVGFDDTLYVSINPDTSIIESGEIVSLIVSTIPQINNATYQWSPTDGLNCTDCPNPIASPEETTVYTVTVNTDNGCSGTAIAIVYVEEPCGEPKIPTIFSPNFDNINDQLCVISNCIESYDLSIYNRWGERVYQSNDTGECWDGMHKGQPASTGVYTYQLVVTLESGKEVTQSGNISLVR